MNYKQVDIALGFLDDDSTIILQVPYARDIALVHRYLVEKLRSEYEKYTRSTILLTRNRIIHIESFGNNEQAGIGAPRGKIFLIDRDHDRSYLDRLEVTGCV